MWCQFLVLAIVKIKYNATTKAKRKMNEFLKDQEVTHIQYFSFWNMEKWRMTVFRSCAGKYNREKVNKEEKQKGIDHCSISKDDFSII